MKKKLYILAFLVVIGGLLVPLLQPVLVSAEDDAQEQSCNVIEDPSCRLTSRIEYALRGKGNKGLDWGDSFGATDPKDVGQNLYLMIYEKTQAVTMGDAIQATADQYGMPAPRMLLILGGDITPILERNPMMRVEEAIAIYNEIRETYEEKKDSLDLEATISTKIEPSEMFADGDVDNSGFDLINDLNNIEIILFQKNEDTTIGGALSSGGSGGEAPPGATEQPLQTPSGNIPIDLGTPTGMAPSSSDTAAQTAAESPVNNPFANQDEDKSAIFVSGINPNQCFSTKSLDNALDDFATRASTDLRLKSTYKGQTPSAGDSTDGGTTPTSGTGSSGVGSADIDVAAPDVSPSGLPPVQPAPAGDYTTPPICEDIVCISLDFIMKPATPAFDKVDNCIQCHVQYINQSLEKTISHSLIPSKATGNLGESGMCKNAAGTALGAVGMNVSINLVPIVTPPKDDLVTLGNIADEWNKYAEKNGFWNYNEDERKKLEAKNTGKPYIPAPTVSDAERMLTIAIKNAPDNATQDEIIKATFDAYVNQKEQESQEMLVLGISKDAYGEVDPMKALDDEMKQMNKYFDGFRKQFLTLLQDVPGLVATKACVKLNDKQQCT